MSFGKRGGVGGELFQIGTWSYLKCASHFCNAKFECPGERVRKSPFLSDHYK